MSGQNRQNQPRWGTGSATWNESPTGTGTGPGQSVPAITMGQANRLNPEALQDASPELRAEIQRLANDRTFHINIVEGQITKDHIAFIMKYLTRAIALGCTYNMVAFAAGGNQEIFRKSFLLVSAIMTAGLNFLFSASGFLIGTANAMVRSAGCYLIDGVNLLTSLIGQALSAPITVGRTIVEFATVIFSNNNLTAAANMLQTRATERITTGAQDFGEQLVKNPDELYQRIADFCNDTLIPTLDQVGGNVYNTMTAPNFLELMSSTNVTLTNRYQQSSSSSSSSSSSQSPIDSCNEISAYKYIRGVNSGERFKLNDLRVCYEITDDLDPTARLDSAFNAFSASPFTKGWSNLDKRFAFQSSIFYKLWQEVIRRDRLRKSQGRPLETASLDYNNYDNVDSRRRTGTTLRRTLSENAACSDTRPTTLIGQNMERYFAEYHEILREENRQRAERNMITDVILGPTEMGLANISSTALKGDYPGLIRPAPSAIRAAAAEAAAAEEAERLRAAADAPSFAVNRNINPNFGAMASRTTPSRFALLPSASPQSQFAQLLGQPQRTSTKSFLPPSRQIIPEGEGEEANEFIKRRKPNRDNEFGGTKKYRKRNNKRNTKRQRKGRKTQRKGKQRKQKKGMKGKQMKSRR
jgi:hypothetical protein